jgi:hypothetical protein
MRWENKNKNKNKNKPQYQVHANVSTRFGATWHIVNALMTMVDGSSDADSVQNCASQITSQKKD